MVAPRYDDSSWPLYRVSLPKGDLGDPEFEVFLETIDGLHLRGQKFAVLIDVRVAPPLSPKRRQAVAEHANAALARYPGLMVGLAVVMSSPLQRGVFTAIQWLIRRSQVARAYGTMSEAEAWLLSRLREEGADVEAASRA